MLNWSLMREPVNWVIVTLMVMVGSLAVNYIGRCVSDTPSS